MLLDPRPYLHTHLCVSIFSTKGTTHTPRVACAISHLTEHLRNCSMPPGRGALGPSSTESERPAVHRCDRFLTNLLLTNTSAASSLGFPKSLLNSIGHRPEGWPPRSRHAACRTRGFKSQPLDSKEPSFHPRKVNPSISATSRPAAFPSPQPLDPPCPPPEHSGPMCLLHSQKLH